MNKRKKKKSRGWSRDGVENDNHVHNFLSRAVPSLRYMTVAENQAMLKVAWSYDIKIF